MLDLQEALRRQDTETLVLYLGDDWMEKVYDLIRSAGYKAGYAIGYSNGQQDDAAVYL